VRRTGIIAIGLAEDDELAWVQLSDGEEHVLLITNDGRAIRFRQSDVRAMGRPAAGVRGIELRRDDVVVAMGLAQPDGDVLVVTANGYGKRTGLAEYPVQRRGGCGVATIRPSDKIGPIVAASITADSHGEMILMSAGGKVIRQPVGQVSRIGRATQGVRVMDLRDGDNVVSMAFIGNGAMHENGENGNGEASDMAPAGEADIDANAAFDEEGSLEMADEDEDIVEDSEAAPEDLDADDADI
jgi:DNA gyrase subunit A